MRPSRRRGNRPVGDSTSNPTSSSSKEDEDAPNLRGARRASARTHRRVARVLSPGSGGEPPRVVPDKIVPDDDTYKGVLDCESYALVNKSVRYGEEEAHGLGRKRKEIAVMFGRESEWNGTPPLEVFEILNRFRKACYDNNLSEGWALYILPEFTEGDLKKERIALLPSKAGGRTEEVSSYLQLVNCLFRRYADEKTLSTQVVEFNALSQDDGEHETAFYLRTRHENALCGYIHTPSQIQGRFMQGLLWEVRPDVREHNSTTVPLEVLVRYAQRKGDLHRRRNEEQRAQRAGMATGRGDVCFDLHPVFRRNVV